MFSKNDIIKALGNDINIVPFDENNLKENSYNLTASNFAWASKDSESSSKYKIKKNSNCVRTIDGIDKIVLLPLSTTLIITKEVLGIGNVGGTYHSKVGLVSAGLGHIGTMLGPKFCGHSLIAVHNISEEIKYIKVGDTFASVVFHKLDSAISEPNSTVNAHSDKFGNLGITEDIAEITQDWKTKIEEISDRMIQSPSYNTFKKKVRRQKFKSLKNYITPKNMILFALFLSILFSPLILTFLVSIELISEETKNTYHNYLVNVGLSGCGVFAMQFLLSAIKPNN